jgi:Protein of unknown function (DUF1553)/Protein of unknown function (DUF1549)/Concanavalin A-like lectin/glucanases superfamily/Planctomycete cytochrome C
METKKAKRGKTLPKGRRFLVVFAAFCFFCFHFSYSFESGTRGQQKIATGSADNRIDFNRDIRPILSDKCWACHGPDAPNLKIKLRLDSESGIKADLGRGRRAVVPGHPEQSELVRRITAEDDLMRMPPVDSGRTLTEREKRLLIEWIKEGAQWEKHWAFVTPVKGQLPKVENRSWPVNAIDYFVLEQLERKGLSPSPEADRATLVRRVSLDLTGLPPTLKEIDDFLHDKSPNAYERVVDRLLASPRYGERMAFRWLDAARYADTNGYQLDGERQMWRWRDWVIEAFNRNMSFDQFTIEQLAGDLLPNPTLDQKIATAFNRNHRGNSEDGLVPEEYAVEYVVDRVDTTSTVFQGLTMGCARCHNHKYDPFTQKEYYQLYAFFNSIPEDGRFSNFGNSPPWIFAPTREQQDKFTRLEKEIAQSKRQLDALLQSSSLLQRRWEQSFGPSTNEHWFPTENLVVYQSLDQDSALVVNERASSSKNGKDVGKTVIGFKDGTPNYVPSPLGQAVAFDGKLFFDAGKAANFDYRDRKQDFKDKFAISAWFYPETENGGAIVTRMRDNVGERENNLPKGRGYGIFYVNGKVHFNLVGVWADDSFRVETADKLPVKRWYHLLATFDGTQPYEKVQIYIDGNKQKLKINNHRLFRQFADGGANLLIGGGGGPDWRFKGAIDDVRIYDALPDEEQIAVLACADSLAKIAQLEPQRRSDAQRLKMRGAFLENGASSPAKRVWGELNELKRRRAALVLTFSSMMVMQELPEPRPAFLLRRGAYDAPAEKVERGTPAVLPPMPADFPNNRLGLAKWLVSPQNPLTARVTVNRFWQMLFGTGLVRTVEDFGTQGESPSHPELLDWLAVEFMSGGARDGETGRRGDLFHRPVSQSPDPPVAWDVKALLKTIVMSATYRQTSMVTPQLLQQDPENRLLGRGPRLRLPAEVIRDQALFLSGLLVEKRGGPSVKPYQPEGLYKDMVFSNMTDYDRDKGEGLWRRSLYTFWKRTVMPPAMQVFNASSREYCTVRETRTNTPLQALNLMNDVTYIEAARMLAERMMSSGGEQASDRLAWAFRQATSRWPDEKERQVLLENHHSQIEYFRSDPKEAEKLLAVGERRNSPKFASVELAAYTATASLILNLDEVITKQ